MKPMKYGVILLALLLAAMAMVPMVGAAGAQQDQRSAASIDKAIVLMIIPSHSLERISLRKRLIKKQTD
ncbi:MAG: hypothetical protein WC362_08710 [Methanoregula sp.]